MTDHELILATLHTCALTEELRDSEIEILAGAIELQTYQAGQMNIDPNSNPLRDSLMILASGEAEISAVVGGEPMTLQLKNPGDVASIISFVGVSVLNIKAKVEIKKDGAVLLLDRHKFEALMYTHPAIVYYVMRGLVRYMHGVARRKNAETTSMSDYLYQIHGRY